MRFRKYFLDHISTYLELSNLGAPGERGFSGVLILRIKVQLASAMKSLLGPLHLFKRHSTFLLRDRSEQVKSIVVVRSDPHASTSLRAYSYR